MQHVTRHDRDETCWENGRTGHNSTVKQNVKYPGVALDNLEAVLICRELIGMEELAGGYYDTIIIMCKMAS